MRSFLLLVRSRLLPAVLVAAGVALVTAGLITYTDPAGGVPATPSPAPTLAPPTVTPLPAPTPSAVATEEPSPSPTAQADRVATRIAIPALRVDLPVIPGTVEYPPCNVAMFLRELDQPGGDGAIYLYAHARRGMFLPLLEQSERNDGEGILGMVVQVWTSDEQLFLYEITEVLRHQTTLDRALDAEREQLWLQTSEGPRGTVPKLQVVAAPLSRGPAPDPADAHPSPEPVVCG